MLPLLKFMTIALVSFQLTLLLNLQMQCIQAFVLPINRFGCAAGGIHKLEAARTATMNTGITRNSIASSFSTLFATATSKPDQDIENNSTPAVKRVPRKFQPFPFDYHQVLTLEVESLTNRGIGICRTNITTEEVTREKGSSENKERIGEESEKEKTTTTSSWVVMVPNVIPGETIQCQIYRNHKSYSEADLLDIITPSPNRIPPPCPLFDKCGGCQYQHMDIQTQRLWKKNQVTELLERVGKLNVEDFRHLIRDTEGTDEVYNYRSKITPHYDQPIKMKMNEDDENIAVKNSNESEVGMEIRAIGFKQKSNRNIIDVPYCFIATEAINDKLIVVREDKFNEAREGRLKRPKKGATLLLRDAHQYNEVEEEDGKTSVLNDNIPIVETDPNVYVKTGVKGLTFRFLAGNFFQNNPYMLPVMVDHVVDAAIKPNKKGEKMTHIIDCYCGSGLFCLSSAEFFDVCVGIEVNEKAVEEASMNAYLNNIENCKFVSASAEAIFMSEDPVNVQSSSESTAPILVRDFPKTSTTVVIDPPRKGCSTEFLDQLYQFAPQRVVYMSCDPATQARDAEGIVHAGYEITSVQPFDLFPQTRHIECLIVFERKE